MAAKPRSYTEDDKRQVVDLVSSTGRTAASVAAEVGLHPTLVSRWIRRYGQANRAAPAAAAPLLKPVPVATADQAAEIARLRRENERLRMARDIRKRASPSLRFRHDKVWTHRPSPWLLARQGHVPRVRGVDSRLLRLAVAPRQQARRRGLRLAGVGSARLSAFQAA